METKLAIVALAALAQETRLEIFRLLVQQGPGGLPAGQIAERLSIPAATLSFHLQQLRHAGLVTAQREGKSIIYAASFATMNALLAYLTQNCCQGRAESCAALGPSTTACGPVVPRDSAQETSL
jgi:DNA-binding transcriptional ArsR family regulator